MLLASINECRYEIIKVSGGMEKGLTINIRNGILNVYMCCNFAQVLCFVQTNKKTSHAPNIQF